MKNVGRIGVMLLGLLVIGIGPSSAQGDLAKVLVGTWKGEVQFHTVRGGGDPTRILRIDSMTEKDGKWIAEGMYGITTLSRVQISVANESKPWIQFVTGANSTVRLN